MRKASTPPPAEFLNRVHRFKLERARVRAELTAMRQEVSVIVDALLALGIHYEEAAKLLDIKELIARHPPKRLASRSDLWREELRRSERSCTAD